MFYPARKTPKSRTGRKPNMIVSLRVCCSMQQGDAYNVLDDEYASLEIHRVPKAHTALALKKIRVFVECCRRTSKYTDLHKHTTAQQRIDIHRNQYRSLELSMRVESLEDEPI